MASVAERGFPSRAPADAIAASLVSVSPLQLRVPSAESE